MKQLLAPIQDVWQLFFPDICASCKDQAPIQSEPFCLNCYLQLPFTDFFTIAENEFKQKFIGRIPVFNGAALLYFTKPSTVQSAIHELKYRGAKEVGIFLGACFGKEMSINWNTKPDLIIPVPMHARKKAKRNYNQAEIFAQGITKHLPLPIITDVLLKEELSNSQTKKSRIERFDNALESYKINKPETLEGKHILLVDDVCTTGATLEACALKLLKIKDVRISFGVIAMAQS